MENRPLWINKTRTWFLKARFIVLLVPLVFLVSCVPAEGQAAAAPAAFTPNATAALTTTPVTPPAAARPVSTATTLPLGVWVDASVPDEISQKITLPEGYTSALSEHSARFKIAPLPIDAPLADVIAEWVYALAVPFPTALDEVAFDVVKEAWQGKPAAEFAGRPLLMTEETRAVLSIAWGEPASSAVTVLGEEQLLTEAWENQPAWAIIPFHKLEPRWKVLKVGSQTPLARNFNSLDYPLNIRFGLVGSSDNAEFIQHPTREAGQQIITNRDPQKMTTLIMTGTTALVRYLALRMEENGVLYPAQNIGNLLRDADLTHVSNEVPFFDKCPPAVPLRREARFCSDPHYLQLLESVGVDLVEVTGNHVLDWGTEPFIDTLDLYDREGLQYFGGGRNLFASQEPLFVEDHGNRLVFIGCNAIGPENILARTDQAGAAPCDLEKMSRQVTGLREKGYLPIFTFQHFEFEEVHPHSAQRPDFLRMADAGAVIVSGSQAHFAQGMKFRGQSFVHFGLGNLFFDQMEERNRPAFIDRHIFYDGRYLGTELITTLLEDYARPRLMLPEEREVMLNRVFQDCEWEDVKE